MTDTWRTTTDTLTRTPFRWNTTVFCVYQGRRWQLPCRCTARRSTWLAPDRVPAALLAELNPDEKAARE